jgi:tripartite-type tricarboxylate transporter receptor subunit TctC
MVVNPSVPANTLPELLKLIRDNPTKYTYANSGVGTPPYILGEMLKHRLSLEMTPVPFGGGVQAIQAVVGGHVPIAFTALTGLPQLIGAGQLRPLAITGTKRSALLPSVPTFAEAEVPDLELGTWTGLLVRKGTPSSISAKLYEQTRGFLEISENVQRLRSIGIDAEPSPREQFSIALAREMTEWARLIKLAKIEQQ